MSLFLIDEEMCSEYKEENYVMTWNKEEAIFTISLLFYLNDHFHDFMLHGYQVVCGTGS